MAQKLGYDNYIGMGYKRMQRIDYTEADVAGYRDEVVAKGRSSSTKNYRSKS